MTNTRTLAFAFFTFLLTLLFCPAGFCVDSEAGAFTRADIKIGGTTRTFYYHLPSGYRGAPTPVVFMFHGGGGNALPFASDIRLSTRADQNNFIAVAPEGEKGRWNYGVDVRTQSPENDVQFSREMITYMETHFKVDPSRIYFGGFSEGAWFTQWATYHIPNKIAAAGVVCALEPVKYELQYGPTHSHLPIAFMLGTGDPRMHWRGGITPNGTDIISANATVWSWVRSNGCNEHAATQDLPSKTDADHSRVDLTYYNGRQGDDVAYYKVIGGGHAWPGAVRTDSPNGYVNEDIDATQVLWDFFKAHPKRVVGYPQPVQPRFFF